MLGGAGLRSREARTLAVDPFDRGRADNQGGAVYLRVHGKGNKIRAVPLYSDVVDALERWRELRDEIPELAHDPHLFPRLGRRRRDGTFPDAGGALSTTALIRVVQPIMTAAGVPPEAAHPHTLRHTFGRLYMSAPRAELSRLQRIMGHASPETTSRYVHHDDVELAAEHSASNACSTIRSLAANSSAGNGQQGGRDSCGCDEEEFDRSRVRVGRVRGRYFARTSPRAGSI